MSKDAATLAPTVLSMRPILPARYFDLSQQFYIALGFEPVPLTDRFGRDAARCLCLHTAGLLCSRMGRQFPDAPTRV